MSAGAQPDAKPAGGDPVPLRLEDASWTGPIHQVAPGRVLVRIPGLARALAGADGSLHLSAEPGATARDLTWFLERPVGDARDLLAGRFTLRAAAVRIGDRAVALVGHGTAGKSTVAATLARRGHGVLADHRLELDLAEGALALAAGPTLELWPDAVERLGLDPTAGTPVRPALSKRAFVFTGAEPARLAGVVVLARSGRHPEPTLSELRGGDAVARLSAATATHVLLGPLALRPAHFRWVVELGRAVRVYLVQTDRERPDAVADAGPVADLVEGLLA